MITKYATPISARIISTWEDNRESKMRMKEANQATVVGIAARIQTRLVSLAQRFPASRTFGWDAIMCPESSFQLIAWLQYGHRVGSLKYRSGNGSSGSTTNPPDSVKPGVR